MQDVTKTKPVLISAMVFFIIGLSVRPVSAATAPEAISAQPETKNNPSTDSAPTVLSTMPDLAEIVPRAAELESRLLTLENKIKTGPDVTEFQKQCSEINADMNDLMFRLQLFKSSHDYTRKKLVNLKERIKRKNELYRTISQPLDQAIQQLDSWRKQWLTKHENWNQWQSSMLQAEQLDQLETTFEKANTMIDTALSQIRAELGRLLTVQAKSSQLQVDMKASIADLDDLIASHQQHIILYTSPPMLSSRYFSQLSKNLRYALKIEVNDISWSDAQFFTEKGWIFLVEGFLFLSFIVSVYRHRQTLKESTRGRFLAERPVSGGLFFFSTSAILLYEYANAQDSVKFINFIIAGICFVRISGVLVQAPWRKHFVYGLTAIYIVTQFLELVEFPEPLLRLYKVLIALASFVFCLRWTAQSFRHNESSLIRFLLRIIALLLAIIIISEIWGKTTLASYLFVSLIQSIAIVLIFMVYINMIHGGAEWLFQTAPLQRASTQYIDTNIIGRRVTRLIEIVICGFVLFPAILSVWGVYNSLQEATIGLLRLGFNWGSQRISIGSVLVALGIIYGSFLVSWLVQKLSIDVLLRSRQIDRGIQYSIKQLIHYAIFVIGFLIALGALGFEVTKITILLSAFGVGIGFGLQGVVNNFVSGLILLFERPVRVGDIVVVNGIWSEIKRIGLRSTILRSFDQSEVIIPNADLITNQVTNWTLSNRRRRLEIKVGVAYGSDILLVTETLMACGKSNPKVDKTIEPQVLFLSFGESSLNFELWVFVSDVRNSLNVISELHQEIDRRFREAKIEIAFPQRDLHLRSLDESVILRNSETNRYIQGIKEAKSEREININKNNKR